jgi:hypothetical protein
MSEGQQLIIGCSICGFPVQLENCKTDGDGKPVHDGCYAGHIISQSANDAARDQLPG